jgi:hypothetical protein
VEASEVMNFVREGGFPTDGIRQMGGMWIKVRARDAWSAVESVAEILERFASRVFGYKSCPVKLHRCFGPYVHQSL